MIEIRVALTDEQVDAIAERAAAILAERSRASDQSGYLDAEQAAAYMATSRGRIYDLVQLRKLPALRDGRRLLFRPGDLDEYLASS